MTIAESDPVLVPAVRVREPAGSDGAGACSIVDTTELRWFFAGPLPPSVHEWFAGSSGVAEQRCDTYLLDGRCDVGVKRRFGETLELKVRQSVDARIELDEGLAGRTEAWRRWSPAEGLVEDGSERRWVDVQKSIVKRRFSVAGTEIAFSPQMTGAGCDVEIVDVTVAAVRGWSFAFAAFGPLATRTEALLASWQTLETATPRPDQFRLATGRAMGYPEWLALTVSSDLA